MLIVSRQQLAAMDANRLDRFRRLVHRHITEVIPDTIAGWPEPRIFDAIDAAIADASGHGLIAERDVARFTALAFALGPDFPRRPETAWTAAVLAGRELEPGARVDQLFARLGGERPDLGALWQAWRP